MKSVGSFCIHVSPRVEKCVNQWCHDESGCVIESGAAEAVFGAPRQPDTVAYLAGLRG